MPVTHIIGAPARPRSLARKFARRCDLVHKSCRCSWNIVAYDEHTPGAAMTKTRIICCAIALASLAMWGTLFATSM
jgi:hypothetical protein